MPNDFLSRIIQAEPKVFILQKISLPKRYHNPNNTSVRPSKKEQVWPSKDGCSDYNPMRISCSEPIMNAFGVYGAIRIMLFVLFVSETGLFS